MIYLNLFWVFYLWMSTYNNIKYDITVLKIL